jgi:hypothetical protein
VNTAETRQCRRCHCPIARVGNAWVVTGTGTTTDGLSYCPPDPDAPRVGSHAPRAEPATCGKGRRRPIPFACKLGPVDPTAPITSLLEDIEAAETAYGELGKAQPSTFEVLQAADDLLDQYRRLFELVQLRAYAPSLDRDADDRTEQVVVTIHGVDLSVRGRTGGEPGEGDLFIHIDTSDRPALDAARYPLTLEVDSSGENTYGEAVGVWECPGPTCQFAAPADEGQDIAEHVRDCNQVDGAGQPITATDAKD